MNFPSIDIQGSILSNDLLAKIRSDQANYQQGKDFRADFTNAKLKDDISLAWQEAKGQWVIFKSKLARLKEGENGTTENRNFWISPLLTNLSYNLTYNRAAEELNGKSFPIGYRDSSLDNFPLYVGGYYESLDKRPENKQLQVSPHAMLQEYLNYSEHLYGIVTNGRQLRLLRNASRITRLSYVEFNLEKMMEEDLYSDFVIFYRLLHASRMPRTMGTGADSIIDKYHQEGLEAGSTIRNKLGEAVKGNPAESKKGAIELLATGFANHPYNTELRAAIAAGNFEEEYYRQMLRIIYRLLFLFVIEERNLVYAESKEPETKRFNYIYYHYYSLFRLRKLAKKLPPPDAGRHYDLWQSLVSTFSLFEKKEIGEKLGIMSLQGDLFGYDAINNASYDLHSCYLGNDVLLKVIKALGYFENERGVFIAVNYGGLDVEEFGSVYEGLLELKLIISKVEGSEQYNCTFDASSERGKSGSHYTPEELVQPLIKHSLEYLIEDRVKPYQQKKTSKEATIQSLLSLKICDVACGSGHILLSAARRLSLEMARVQTDEEQPNPMAIRKAMKDVVRSCIYGVDKNPLAVELCKIALWLEAYNPGEPLNFLDHHIKCGDAIVGLAHREELENGIATEAFKYLEGIDNKDISKSFRDANTKERKERESKATQLKAQFEQTTETSVQEAMAEYKIFNQLPESTPEEIERKARAYKKFIDGKGFLFLKTMADTQVAQFYIPKTSENKDRLMTDADYRLMLSGYKGWQGAKTSYAGTLAHERRFFHWFIEFPEVVNSGGFDCILGNPPYLGTIKFGDSFGDEYTNCILSLYAPTGGKSDLAAYFLRRDFNLINTYGFLSIITTNTISSGDTKEGGLNLITKEGGHLVYANPNIKWPGNAAVTVTLFSVTKRNSVKTLYIGTTKVKFISTNLTDFEININPDKLKANKKLGFVGSYLYGEGFIVESKTAAEIISSDSIYEQVLFPYLNGRDLNDSPALDASRYVINFFSWNEEKAKQYPLCYKILEETVKNERATIYTEAKQVHEWDFWKYWDKREDDYRSIKGFENVIVAARTSKTLAFAYVKNVFVYSSNLTVLSNNKLSFFFCYSFKYSFKLGMGIWFKTKNGPYLCTK